ncbi:NDP-sugar synthase [Candidatus Bathyarchaeota archaeon]|nr:NDP-sugar synthase [Candidatus Bathyarchaeota archaeon]
MQKIYCFIPVGGAGRRLMPLTVEISKPCIRFLNRPLIEFSIVELAEQGIRDFVFGAFGYTNYSNLFDQYGEGVGVSAKYNIHPRIHIKHQPNLDDLGSAHSFWLNVEYYDIQDLVLVIQGDSIFKINLSDFVAKHEERNALMSIALVDIEDTTEYGVAELGEDMRIKKFVEKPSKDEAPSHFVSTGIYLLSPKVRKLLGERDLQQIMEQRNRLDFGFDFIPHLIERGYPIYGHPINIWYDIGTPARYLQAMRDILHGKIDIKIAEEKILPDQNIWVQGFSEDSIRRRTEIIREYEQGKLFLEGAVLIGRHTRIDDYTKIIESCIDDFCILRNHVQVERSAIMDGCTIGENCKITDSIIGRKVIIESSEKCPTSIEKNSVVGSSCKIREGCRLVRTKVNPNLIIPKGMIYVDKFLQTYEDEAQLSS